MDVKYIQPCGNDPQSIDSFLNFLIIVGLLIVAYYVFLWIRVLFRYHSEAVYKATHPLYNKFQNFIKYFKYLYERLHWV